MNTSKPHFKRAFLTTVLVIGASILVLLASCATKSSIKSLIGLPVPSEQGVGANHSAMVGNSNVCSFSQLSEIETTAHAGSIDLKQLGPALLLAVSFLFFAGYALLRQPADPRYSSKKLSSSLPLYLQYQHLRIFS